MTKREIIYNKFGGKCAYCGCGLQKYWHIDHLLPVVRCPHSKVEAYPERNNLSNMMPSCPSCNNYKHSFTLDEFRRLISDLKNQLELKTQYRIAKRYGLISEHEIDVLFYFETYKKQLC